MKTYDDVRTAFDKGTAIDATKEDLEQLLIAVGQARILDPVNQARASEMGETMRQLLAARQSQAMHSQALAVSELALFVSGIALLVSVAQGLAAFNVIAPLKAPAVAISDKPQSERLNPAPQSNAPRHQSGGD